MPDPLFDEVIRQVLKELSPDLKEALASVQIVVLPRPTAEQLKENDQEPDDDLLGLFEGLSLKDQPVGEARVFPDRITLFEESLKDEFPNRRELAKEIRKTLLHELGHFFGFDEDELKRRGYE
jgi:predicted Zn-dependent protease with MMP-like domain